MAQPTLDKDRIQSLDIMRGFALLGILLANSVIFQYGMAGTTSFGPVAIDLYPNGSVDRATHFIIQLFVDGSFYTLFSFLFGYGMALQKERLLARNVNFSAIYWRRTILLLVFGLLHLFLLWRGDILVGYALAAMILFVFLLLPTRAIGIVAIVWLSLFASTALLPPVDAELMTSGYPEDEAQVLAHGSYAEVVQFRLNNDLGGITDIGFPFWIGESLFQFTTVLGVFGMFLAGAYTARKKWLENPSEHTKLFAYLLVGTGVLGLAAKLPHALSTDYNTQLEYLSQLAGAPLVAMFYATSVVLLANSRVFWRLLSPLAVIGRMAFSNYILQSLVFTTLFYGYGVGMFAELGLFYGALLALAFFVVQVLVSNLWLSVFRIGPLEYIWRMGTYLSLPRLKR
ncbi:DUF418 domain-containing protein [Shouchella shacheensis]|uniref:DUF418 domain-containing protein n=1 Tax=Shouchella shacheensis TaxID=1649580 RepID=UPI0007400CDF|nr:DUF418 domain-containing protein [Shouchella shacheensis]